jgi:hypothetical protein
VTFYTMVDEKKKGRECIPYGAAPRGGRGGSGTVERHDTHMVGDGRSPGMAAARTGEAEANAWTLRRFK